MLRGQIFIKLFKISKLNQIYEGETVFQCLL